MNEKIPIDVKLTVGLTAVLLFAVVAGATTVSAQSEDGRLELSPDQVSLEQRGSKTINITYERTSDATAQGIQYTLEYNPDVISVTDQQQGSYLEGIKTSDTSTPGEVVYAEIGGEPIEKDSGTVATITIAPACDINSGAKTDVEFTTAIASEGGAELDVMASGGTVEIESSTEPCDSENNNRDNNAGGSSGNGGGGGGGSDATGSPSSDDSERPPTIEEVRSTLNLVDPSTETISEVVDADPDTPGVTVRPENTDLVNTIRFEDENVAGTVETNEYTHPPDLVQTEISESMIGSGVLKEKTSVISISEISASDESGQDSQATIEFSVPADKINDPENIAIVKEEYDFEIQDDTWVKLQTNLEEVNEDKITVSAKTDGFSIFVIAEVGSETTNQTDQSDNGESSQLGESQGTDDSIPGFRTPVAVLAVIAVTMFGRYIK